MAVRPLPVRDQGLDFPGPAWVAPTGAAAGAGPGRVRLARAAASGLSVLGRLVRPLPGAHGSAGGRVAGAALAALPRAAWCWRDGGAFSPAIRELRLSAAAPAMTTASASASPARAAVSVRMRSPNKNTPSRLAASGSKMVNPGWEAASGPAASACEASSMVTAPAASSRYSDQAEKTAPGPAPRCELSSLMTAAMNPQEIPVAAPSTAARRPRGARHLALKRAIRHAEANDLVTRNVAALADTPKGQDGRPSKSLTLDQAVAVITAARTLPVTELRPGLKDVRRPAELMHAHIVLSLLTGIRTEEARALRWVHVDLDGDPAARPPVPPHVAVWRSVRTHGETKTERSRRTLGLPQVAVQARRAWSASQAGERLAAGDDWQDTGLVFTNHLGAALDAGNVRKMFKRICTEAGDGDGWTPRELRTTFVSLLSHRGVSIEEIARLAGHASTRTTEIVYRRELRPVITTGAEIMDELFGAS